jgi:putative membrane protein
MWPLTRLARAKLACFASDPSRKSVLREVARMVPLVTARNPPAGYHVRRYSTREPILPQGLVIMRTTPGISPSRFAPAVALAVALTAAPSVWAQTTQDSAAHRTWNIPGRVPTTTTPTTTTPTTTPTTTTPATTPTTAVQGVADTAFVREVRTDNLLEIRLGALAAKRSTNAAVKQFAQRMVSDHTAMGNEWTSLASRLRLGTTSALNAGQQQLLSRLSTISAADFDREYMSYAVQDHQTNIATFQRLGPSAQSLELRQLAAKGLPVLEQHLAMAQQVASQVGAEVATTTNGLPENTSTGQTANNNKNNSNARSDQAYVQELWRGHEMQVQLAQLAQNKARDSKVKDFANNMRKDFQDYLDRWTNVAQKNNITLPNHIGNLHQDKVDRLKKASGKDVDRVYLDIVKETVGSMVPYYQKEGRDAQSSAVRNLVNQELPIIRQHLDRAETLDRQVTTASAKVNDKDKNKDKNKSASNAR